MPDIPKPLPLFPGQMQVGGKRIPNMWRDAFQQQPTTSVDSPSMHGTVIERMLSEATRAIQDGLEVNLPSSTNNFIRVVAGIPYVLVSAPPWGPPASLAEQKNRLVTWVEKYRSRIPVFGVNWRDRLGVIMSPETMVRDSLNCVFAFVGPGEKYGKLEPVHVAGSVPARDHRHLEITARLLGSRVEALQTELSRMTEDFEAGFSSTCRGGDQDDLRYGPFYVSVNLPHDAGMGHLLAFQDLYLKHLPGDEGRTLEWHRTPYLTQAQPRAGFPHTDLQIKMRYDVI